MKRTSTTTAAQFRLVLLLFLVFLAYVPSLSGGFLNFDDPWMVSENALYLKPSLAGLWDTWTDFGEQTRLLLGAEYLPLRDTSVWIEAQVYGLNPQLMRATNLAIYLVAIATMTHAMRRTLGNNWRTDFLVALFALHPIHAESVAWITGRKDVLGLLFFGLALLVHAGKSRHRKVLVPLLVAGAQLSKVLFVVTVAIFVLQDLLAKRSLVEKRQYQVYARTAVVSLAIVFWQWSVSQSVGMTWDPPGGSRLHAAMTMGPVWLRYLQALFFPSNLSIVQEVASLTRWSLPSIVGVTVVLFGLVGALYVWRKHANARFFVAWGWFFLPLVPVSQLVVFVQHSMADRYLLISVMGGCIFIHLLLEEHRRFAPILAGVLCATLWATTMHRALLFSDNILIFQDAVAKTEHDALAPYQLGMAWEAEKNDEAAISSYAVALERDHNNSESARRATNNIAKLLARRGDLTGAEHYLREGQPRWPSDPKLFGNLAEVVRRQPAKRAEALMLYRQLVTKFPHYKPGLQRFNAYFPHVAR